MHQTRTGADTPRGHKLGTRVRRALGVAAFRLGYAAVAVGCALARGDAEVVEFATRASGHPPPPWWDDLDRGTAPATHHGQHGQHGQPRDYAPWN